MRSLSWSRWARLPATSKTVSQLREAAEQLVGSAAEIGVHRSFLCPVRLQTSKPILCNLAENDATDNSAC
jgi:hypothetical protein